MLNTWKGSAKALFAVVEEMVGFVFRTELSLLFKVAKIAKDHHTQVDLHKKIVSFIFMVLKPHQSETASFERIPAWLNIQSLLLEVQALSHAGLKLIELVVRKP